MKPGQYVVFCIDEEFFGLPIEQVEQILHAQPITRIPNTSQEVLGVINLRGKTINVVDTRALLGFPAAPAKTFIVVTALDQRFAVTSDKVDCIISFAEKEIEKSTDCEFYVGKQKDRLVVLIPTEKLASKEVRALEGELAPERPAPDHFKELAASA